MSEKNDIITVGPQVAEDGTHLCLRERNGNLEELYVRPITEGKPLSAEDTILSLSHRQANTYDVVDSYEPKRTGPAQVATRAYRANYERIFGGHASVGQA